MSTVETQRLRLQRLIGLDDTKGVRCHASHCGTVRCIACEEH